MRRGGSSAILGDTWESQDTWTRGGGGGGGGGGVGGWGSSPHPGMTEILGILGQEG